MSSGYYTPGSMVTVTATFLNPISGQLIDPDSVKLRVLDPTNVETDYDSLSPVANVYSVSIGPVTKSGMWRYRFESTGVYAAASEGAFTVSSTPFPAD